MLPDRERVVRRVLTFEPLALTAANDHRLDLDLVLGIVCQESAGVPTALRPEPGFWRRYGANILRAALASKSQRDDRWMAYPEIASASYGLMQVMYPVAIEDGMDLRYPTDLCDPAIGLDAGCLHFAKCLQRAGGPTRPGLLRYNGGGDPRYDDKVLAWRDDVVLLRGK